MSMKNSSVRFTFEVEGLTQTFHVARFEGVEGLSELFRIELTLICDNDAVAFDDILGARALLTLHGDASERHLHGIISRFEQTEAAGRHAMYRATLAPHVFRLKLRQTCRVFQQLDTASIVQRVLMDAGVAEDEHSFKLSQKEYRVREHCIQYRESDWAFISRLLEEEGIFYFFEHRRDKHILVMADSPYAHDPIPGAEAVVFRAEGGALVSEEHVSRFRYAQEMRSTEVTLRDYNFKRPAHVLESEARGPSAGNRLEVYDFPGDYDDPRLGSELARIRLEEQQADGRVGAGESSCLRLLPGHLFTMREHPRDDFNRRYLLTKVEHKGSQPAGGDSAGGEGEAGYSNRFTSIPKEVPFRPPQGTPKPAARGAQTALVVGPAGEEIYTDEYGRVKVRFHWDRGAQKPEHSSCWIRVSQMWAGQGWGSMHIPRVGQEVIVDFLDGDLDRPLITGSVYHGTNLTPYSLPADKTKSTIRSSSSPGGEGSNELTFEDKKGAEEIYLHGQRNWSIAIEHDKGQVVGNDETLAVGHNRTKTVGADQSETIGAEKTITVGGSHTESIGVNESIAVRGESTLKVGANRSELVGANKSVMVGANQSEVIGINMTIAVGGRMTETVAAESVEKVGADKDLTVDGRYAVVIGGDMSTAVDRSHTEEIKLTKTTKVGKKIAYLCGDSRIIVDERGKIVIEGSDVTIRSTRPVKVLSKKLQVKSSGSVDVKAAGTVKVKGTIVGIN